MFISNELSLHEGDTSEAPGGAAGGLGEASTLFFARGAHGIAPIAPCGARPTAGCKGSGETWHLGLYRPPFPPTAPPRVPLCPPTQGARTVALSLSCSRAPAPRGSSVRTRSAVIFDAAIKNFFCSSATPELYFLSAPLMFQRSLSLSLQLTLLTHPVLKPRN